MTIIKPSYQESQNVYNLKSLCELRGILSTSQQVVIDHLTKSFFDYYGKTVMIKSSNILSLSQICQHLVTKMKTVSNLIVQLNAVDTNKYQLVNPGVSLLITKNKYNSSSNSSWSFTFKIVNNQLTKSNSFVNIRAVENKSTVHPLEFVTVSLKDPSNKNLLRATSLEKLFSLIIDDRCINFDETFSTSLEKINQHPMHSISLKSLLREINNSDNIFVSKFVEIVQKELVGKMDNGKTFLTEAYANSRAVLSKEDISSQVTFQLDNLEQTIREIKSLDNSYSLITGFHLMIDLLSNGKLYSTLGFKLQLSSNVFVSIERGKDCYKAKVKIDEKFKTFQNTSLLEMLTIIQCEMGSCPIGFEQENFEILSCPIDEAPIEEIINQ
jgi:hypothetical protein